MNRSLACVALLMFVLLPIHAAAQVQKITPIEKITSAFKGKFATVQAEVVSQRRFKSGVRFELKDDTGKMTLVVFDRELKQAPKELGEGATVNVTGKIDFYKKEKQIVPVRGTDVIVIRPAKLAEPPLPIIEIKNTDKDKLVTVQGTVAEATNFSTGFKFVLNDGTGQIRVVFFENVFDGLAKPSELNVGAIVRVAGRVDLYNNELEIIPSSAGKTSIVESPKRETKRYDLGSIGGNDHNALVEVEGTIVDIQSFEFGTDVFLKDATGAQKIRLYQVVAKRVQPMIKIGAKWSAVGRVRASKSTGVRIEIAVPSDIALVKQAT
jgi:RecJ-like exonuclease